VRGNGIDWNLAGEVNTQTGDPAHQTVIPASIQLQSQRIVGQTLTIDLLWHALNKIDAYYSASVRVIDARGQKIAAQDREPSPATFLWRPDSEIADRFEIRLPDNLAPGEYAIQILMYQADQGIDALLLDENLVPRENIVLGKFTVK
jgi:hypothetical protein